MAEEILLDYAINRPNVPVSNEETDLKVLLKINAANALRQGGSAPGELHTHLALVLDVSSSMRAAELDALKEAAKAAVSALRPGDFVTVIAFQSVAYEIVEPTRLLDSSTQAAVHKKIEVIDQYQGGGTDMEHALTRAEHALSMINREELHGRIMLFTDGQLTGNEELCLKRAAEISARGYGLDAMGFGQEFDYKFMQRLVSYSNGYTEKIERPEEIKQVFARRVEAVTTTVAKNVRLDLTFTPQVRAKRGYRFSPELAYLGKMKLPGNVRTISIPIGTIERDKEYAYIVTLTVPSREEGTVRVIKAELFYDIPSLQLTQGSSTQSVLVQYTSDGQLISHIDGEVERSFDEAEIGRLVEGLDRAMARGEGRDAALFFDTLAERYRELGDEQMATHYVELKQKYAQQGKISQEDMNYTRHKATQKRASNVQLVDASSLI